MKTLDEYKSQLLRAQKMAEGGSGKRMKPQIKALKQIIEKMTSDNNE